MTSSTTPFGRSGRVTHAPVDARPEIQSGWSIAHADGVKNVTNERTDKAFLGVGLRKKLYWLLQADALFIFPELICIESNAISVSPIWTERWQNSYRTDMKGRQKHKNSVGMEIGIGKCTSSASDWNLSEMRRNEKSNFDKQLLQHQDNILSSKCTS